MYFNLISKFPFAIKFLTVYNESFCLNENLNAYKICFADLIPLFNVCLLNFNYGKLLLNKLIFKIYMEISLFCENFTL